jgi:hypothetical protein
MSLRIGYFLDALGSIALSAKDVAGMLALSPVAQQVSLCRSPTSWAGDLSIVHAEDNWRRAIFGLERPVVELRVISHCLVKDRRHLDSMRGQRAKPKGGESPS